MGFRQITYARFVPFLMFLLVLSTVTPRAYALTAEDEKNLGKKILLEIEKSGDILTDLPLQAFLDRVGRSLVAEAGPTPFEFKFYLIKAQEPNAFAIPGGYVFVSTGLLVLAENEQEVAGVLGHEIAHVTMRHISQLMDRSKRINLASLAAMIAGVLLARGGQGSEAIAATAMATSEALTLKFSRENETDADQNGLHYLVRAGYDPAGLLSFLKRISKYGMASAPKIPAYLSTHPATEDRLALLDNLIQIEPKKKGPVRTSTSYAWVRARAFVNEREPHAAVSYYESILKADPHDMAGLLGLGLAQQKTGRLDRSIETFEKALSLAPQDPDFTRELGVGYYLSGKLDEAITNLEAVRSLSLTGSGQKDDLMLLYYLGRAYQEKSDLVKATDLFLRVQKNAPDFPEVYHSLGSVYGRMGDKAKSHYYFGKYFKLRGDRNSALLHFRTSMEALGRASPEGEELQREMKDLTQDKPK